MKAHIASVYRWILSGKLRAWRRSGGRYLMSRADVERLLVPVEARERIEIPEAAPGIDQKRYERALEELKRKGLAV